MTNLEITRLETSYQGTFGVLSLNNGIICFTLELPWKMNQQSISCIPPGSYSFTKYESKTFKRTCISVENVYNRTAVKIHQGNTISDTNGCILPGLSLGRINERRAVLSSNKALDLILVNSTSGILTIKENY